MTSPKKNMTNYFFISSPLHFFIASNLAISHSTDKNIAIFITKNRKNCERYVAAAQYFSTVFQQTYNLPFTDDKKIFRKRRHCFNQIKRIISSHVPDKIFTGNDRRVEFQYTMYEAQKHNNTLQGVYMDDGAISYLGHKSINKFTHKHIDPLLKKIAYGLWWDSPLTVGSSKWISSAYLAFPEQAHPLLESKKLIPIDHKVFSSALFLQISSFLTKSYPEKNLCKLKLIICLPCEKFYVNDAKGLESLASKLSNNYQADEIAIKAHPRSKNIALLKETFEGCQFLPANLGMELLLPKLDQNTNIIGDVSTTLLTTKWLRPDLSVFTVELNTKTPPALQRLFESIGITPLA